MFRGRALGVMERWEPQLHKCISFGGDYVKKYFLWKNLLCFEFIPGFARTPLVCLHIEEQKLALRQGRIVIKEKSFEYIIERAIKESWIYIIFGISPNLMWWCSSSWWKNAFNICEWRFQLVSLLLWSHVKAQGLLNSFNLEVFVAN